MSKTNLNIENYNNVVAAIQANNHVVGDDHNSGTGTHKAAGIAALVKGDKITPVLLIDAIAHCLNLTYLDENGKPRVSRTSVAGNVEGFRHGYDLTKAVAAYNDQQAGNEWSLGTLEHVVIFRMN